MPGYWYGEKGTAYAYLTMDGGHLYGGFKNSSGSLINAGSLGFNNNDGIMRYRSWALGGIDNSPTTNTGNNEINYFLLLNYNK